jgi:Protein kinase domain
VLSCGLRSPIVLTVGEQGQVIAGRYRLRVCIGRGNMGRVWQARDEVLDRDVAVKEIMFSSSSSVDPQSSSRSSLDRQLLCARFTREARAAGKLDHPSVITVHDVVEDSGQPWIVMELFHGASLKDLLASGPLPPQRVADIGSQLAQALQEAHEKGVVHRDIKPANVMVSRSRSVLTDFGIAAVQGDPTLTEQGVVMGSRAYMAPEHARGQPVAASDMWSLGVMLYEAVEGRLPYQSLAAPHAGIPPDPPRRAGPLRPVLMGLLTVDASRRLTASRAVGLLGQVAAGTAVHAASAGPAATAAPLPPVVPGRHPGTKPVQPGQAGVGPPRPIAPTAELTTASGSQLPISSPPGNGSPGRPRTFGTPAGPPPVTTPTSPVNGRAMWWWLSAAAVILIVIVAVILNGGPSPPPAVKQSSSSRLHGWLKPQTVDTSGDQLGSISCPTEGFCIAVSDDIGKAYFYSKRKWSTGIRLDNEGLSSVSCSNASFCIATGSDNRAYIYDKGKWTTTRLNSPELTSVSCVPGDICQATGNLDSFTYSGGSWRTRQRVEGDSGSVNTLQSISCVTSSFCMAVDDAGNAFTYTHSSWSVAYQIVNSNSADNNEVLVSVSCATTTFCAAVSESGNVYIYPDGGWSPGRQEGFTSVSCLAVNFCFAVGDGIDYYSGGEYAYSDDGSWHTTGPSYSYSTDSYYTDISCPNRRFCMATDDSGDAFPYFRG